MYYLALLLEKVADLFPLSMKFDFFFIFKRIFNSPVKNDFIMKLGRIFGGVLIH